MQEPALSTEADIEANDAAGRIIAQLGLEPHPEGGWYRQTWQGEPTGNGRAAGTAIHFLLEGHQRSHWHTVDATEIWLWHAGAPIALSIAPANAGPVMRHHLGPDVLVGQAPQVLVPAGHWQAAEPMGGWALVSCVVVPGFRFEGFTLARDGWTPGSRADV